MTGFEWFLLVVVVILVPLAIAVAVTLWTLEQARKRNRRNRPNVRQAGVARRATRDDGSVTSTSTTGRGYDDRADHDGGNGGGDG